MKHYIVTGGAGFIGSHMVSYLLDVYPECRVVCIDHLNYSSNHLLQNLKEAIELPRLSFIKLDLAEVSDRLYEEICGNVGDSDEISILHFAAESCVDRSFVDPIFFTRNNIFAMQNILEVYREFLSRDPNNGGRMSLVHISTDEVYGEQAEGQHVDETSSLSPTNPYAATKAACDLILNSYIKSYGLRASIIRANNVYGPRQYPEKLISGTLDALSKVGKDGLLCEEDKIMIHGDGSNMRSYLHVSDFIRAVDIVEGHALKTKIFGETFNVGVAWEKSNRDMVAYICSVFLKERFGITEFRESDYITYTKDRCYNDSRYLLNFEKITSLGWAPRIALEKGIMDLVRINPVKSLE